MSAKRSRVHPPYKTRYRVTNWATYNQALVDRGSLGLWISPEAISSWNAKHGKRVWCKNSIARLGSPPFVVVEHPAQPFASLDS